MSRFSLGEAILKFLSVHSRTDQRREHTGDQGPGRVRRGVVHTVRGMSYMSVMLDPIWRHPCKFQGFDTEMGVSFGALKILLFLKWIANKDPLYSTGSFTPYNNLNGERIWKK